MKTESAMEAIDPTPVELKRFSRFKILHQCEGDHDDINRYIGYK